MSPAPMPNIPGPNVQGSAHSEKEAELTMRASAVDRELKALRAEVERVGMALIDLERAKKTIQEAKEGAEFLFPIGKFIVGKGTLASQNFLVNVGGQYYLELPPEKALEKIEQYLAETKSYSERLNGQIKEAEKELISIIKEARSLEQ